MTEKAGHNSGNVAGDRLRSYIEQIERLDEKKQVLSSDIKNIFGAAKSAGFDVKALRVILAQRKMEPGTLEELVTLTNMYRRALGEAELDIEGTGL